MKGRAAFALALLLAGCSYGYRASGHFAGSNETLTGSVHHSLAGGGQFTLAGADGLICQGRADPPTTPARNGNCQGEGGSGNLHCNDGRRFPIAWQATSCRSFTGSGVDPEGRQLDFTVTRPRSP